MAEIEAFYIRQGDLLEELEATLVDRNGNAVDLSEGVDGVAFHMARGNASRVSGAATIVDGAAGKVKYAWATGDTDTAGRFKGEFQVTYTSGTKTLTFPNYGGIPIVVTPELG